MKPDKIPESTHAKWMFQRWKKYFNEHPSYRIRVENELAMLEYEGRGLFRDPEKCDKAGEWNVMYGEYPDEWFHPEDDEYSREAPVAIVSIQDFPEGALERVEIDIPDGVALNSMSHPTKSALAEQVGGDHYKDCKIQPLEYAYANDLDVCEHAIVKYITRHKKKGQVQDLEKVIHYARLEAKLIYGVDI